MKKILLVTLALFSNIFINAQAADYGVVGNTYKIKERNLIEVLQGKMQKKMNNGEWDKELKGMQDKTKGFIDRPKGVLLPVAKKYSAISIDVTYRLPKDILDSKGKILHEKGKVVNPLEVYPIKRGLCFIDGDDKDQVVFAKSKCYPNEKIVLVNGSYSDVAKKLDVRIYFDQKQQLVNRFKVSSVPTVIRQSGNVLMKETFVP